MKLSEFLKEVSCLKSYELVGQGMLRALVCDLQFGEFEIDLCKVINNTTMEYQNVNFRQIIEKVEELENKLERVENNAKFFEKERNDYQKKAEKVLSQVEAIKKENEEKSNCIKIIEKNFDKVCKENEELKSRYDNVISTKDNFDILKKKADKYDNMPNIIIDLLTGITEGFKYTKLEDRSGNKLEFLKGYDDQSKDCFKINNQYFYFNDLYNNEKIIGLDARENQEEIEEKALKYDNMHSFAKLFDKGILEGKNLINSAGEEIYIDNGSLIFKDTSYSIDCLEIVEEKQETHFFDFDYDLLEKLYDKGIYLCNYLENANNRYCEYELSCNGFSKSLITYKETFLKWSAHKDNKQLTKEEIEELVNE